MCKGKSEKICVLSTSFGRPPGFIAMALTNSGETHRMGERTGTSGEGLSSEPFWYWPSLVMRWRGRVAGSSKDAVRACTPETTRKWVLTSSTDFLQQFHHLHQRLMVVSHFERSLHRPCAFCRHCVHFADNQTLQTFCRRLWFVKKF